MSKQSIITFSINFKEIVNILSVSSIICLVCSMPETTIVNVKDHQTKKV